MLLDTNGLPLPGRETDYWLEDHLFGRHDVDARHYSTCADFFQVMEAMENHEWRFSELDNATFLYAELWKIDLAPSAKQLWLVPRALSAPTKRLWIVPASCRVSISDYPDREHAYAHAVCCCAWKAMGGADGD